MKEGLYMKNVKELILCFGVCKTITFKNGKYESYNLDDYATCAIGDTAYNTIVTGNYDGIALPEMRGYRRDQIGEKIIVKLDDWYNKGVVPSWFLRNLILKDKGHLLKDYKITSTDIFKTKALHDTTCPKYNNSPETNSDKELILKWIKLISHVISNSELNYSCC